jgi:uncharacterized damage-inducible protein DinB
MTPDTFAFLAKYNAHVNNAMFSYISKLSDEEWKKEFPGFYKSVKQLCNHIYIADFNWLKRFGLVRQFKYLENPILKSELTPASEAFVSIDDYNIKRKELDLLINEFVSELTQEDLKKVITYKNLKGEPQTRNAGGSAMHIFNHGTHHRGMISLYLELLGHSNDFNSLIALA